MPSRWQVELKLNNERLARINAIDRLLHGGDWDSIQSEALALAGRVGNGWGFTAKATCLAVNKCATTFRHARHDSAKTPHYRACPARRHCL